MDKTKDAHLSTLVETGLKHVIAAEFGVNYHVRSVGRLLKPLGFSHMSPRPRHPMQDGETIAAFNKTSRARSRHISPA